MARCLGAGAWNIVAVMALTMLGLWTVELQAQGNEGNLAGAEWNDSNPAEIAGAPTILVTNTDDDGTGSLRQAILDANAAQGMDVIGFAIPGEPPHVIMLISGGLPRITDDVVIAGLADPAHIVIDGNMAHRPFVTDLDTIVTLERLTIRRGQADIFGGGALLNNWQATVSHCIITENTSLGLGGGILTSGTQSLLTVSHSTISHNTTTGNSSSGGGLALRFGATATVEYSSIIGNSVSLSGVSHGGGIHVAETGSLTLFSSFVADNYSPSSGGGIWTGGAARIVNSTICNNRAAFHGGGMRQDTGALTLLHTTITANVADSDGNGSGDGGGWSETSGVTSFENCLMAGNIDRGGERPDVDTDGASTTSFGYNLIGNVGTLNFTSNAEGDQYGDPNSTTTPNTGAIESSIAIDPLLTLMPVDLGGTTPVYGLRMGSVAINAGNPTFVSGSGTPPVFFDQRGEGFPRVNGGRVDIGAYESGTGTSPNLFPLVVDTTDDVDNGLFIPGDRSLREAMLIAESRFAFDTITFAIPGPAPHTITLAAALPDCTDALDIIGPGDPGDLIIDGNSAHRPFTNSGFSQLALENLTVTRGYSAQSGGGIFAIGFSLRLANCWITDCTSDLAGGAIEAQGVFVTVERSLISNNNAVAGGGISVWNGSTLTCRDSTITGNYVIQTGGGIWLGSHGDIVNTTISGNRADLGGGGVYGSGIGDGNVNINHCTITNNVADNDNNGTGRGGGIMDMGGGIFLLYDHCIIAGNIDRGGERPDVSSFGSLGYNLIGSAGTLELADNTTGDIYGDPNNTTTPNPGATEYPIAVNPVISALAGFGGSLPVHKPYPYSLTVNAGDPDFNPADFDPALDTDQRGAGFPRVLGGRIDIGAVETDGSPIAYTVDKGGDQDNEYYGPGDLTIREAIILANTVINPDEIHFALPGPAPHTIILSGDLPPILDWVRIVGPGTPQDIIIDGDLSFRPFLIAMNQSLTLENLTIFQASGGVEPGGAIQNIGGILKLINCHITHCGTAADGGAIESAGGEVVIERSVIRNNVSGLYGGALHVWGNGSLLCRDSTISDNYANTHGGGIYVGTPAEIINSTISGNKADDDAGGLLAEAGSGFVYVNNSTIANNTADADNNMNGDGGGLVNIASSVQIVLHNSLVAGNITMTGQKPDISGTLLSNGYNFIGNLGAETFANNTIGDQYGDLMNTTTPNAGALESPTAINPLLGPLEDNGGPTPTQALLAASPARNAGNPAFDPGAFDPPLTTDQRGGGIARVSEGRIDIGAFESAPPVALCRNITVYTQSVPVAVEPIQVDNGSFDPDGQSVQLVLNPPGDYPEGVTMVNLVAIDKHGLTVQCDATITVEIINAHGWMIR